MQAFYVNYCKKLAQAFDNMNLLTISLEKKDNGPICLRHL